MSVGMLADSLSESRNAHHPEITTLVSDKRAIQASVALLHSWRSVVRLGTRAKPDFS